MEQTSSYKTPYLLFPFRGLVYFLTHPRYWPLQIVAMLLLMLCLAGIFTGVLFITWPSLYDMSWWPELWGIIKSIGLSLVAALVGFIILMPLFLTFALDKMVRHMLERMGEVKKPVGLFKSVYSSTVIFFKTLFWRLFWPVVGLFSALFLGPFGLFIAQVGIGHLAVIDGVDLSLAMKGINTSMRIELYKKKRMQIFCVGVVSGLLSMLLSFSIIGWLIWVPSVVAGSALWVVEWDEV